MSIELLNEEKAAADNGEPAGLKSPEQPETVIEPSSGWRGVDWRGLWRFRELLFFLAWRDIAVRYKQTVLGIAWAVLQPLATMVVFSLFLGRASGITERVEFYPLFVLAGLLPWGLFHTAVTSAGNSLVGNQALITKVYFPRLIVPISAAGVSLVDFAVGAVLLALMMPFVGAAPDWGLLFLPVVVLLLFVSAVGVGTLLAALSVSYRDFRYVIPFGVQLWMFATPVIYLPVEVLGPTTRAILPVNPAYGLVLNFRNCALGSPIDWYSFGVSGSVAIALFVIGTLYFRRVERSFADVI